MKKYLTSGISLAFLLSLILVIIWFRKGYLLGGGEAGIPFVNLHRYLYYSSSTWVETVLGIPSLTVLGSLPVFAILNFLYSGTGMSPLYLQTLLFWIFLFLSGVSVYWIIEILFPNKVIGYVSLLFYLFNLFVLFNVWFRFQYPYMFFYALLPLGFFLFLKGIEERKFHYVLLFNLASLVFVMALSVIPLLEFFWLILGSYLLFFTAVYWQDKRKVIFSWIFLFLSIGVWVIFNAWWLLQFIKVLFTSSYITSQAYTAGSDIGTFTALSNMLGNLSYVFRLMHSYFLTNMKEVWGPIYFTPPFVILSYVIPFLAFFPLLLKKKPKILYYFLGLSLALVFLMKGSADPFGGIFLFLFSHLRFLEAFRNPFEKLGLALPFAYAPLVGYSLFIIFNWLKTRWGNLKATTSLLVVCCLLFIILVFPMWNGWVFTSGVPPTNNLKIGDYVKVPAYYKEANTWLNRQGDDFRAIALPIGGEGINYDWEYGYNGVELSNTLFDKPFISLCTTIEYLCPIANSLEPLLLKYPNHFWKALPPLNAKYILLRNDINWKLRDMQNPEEIKEVLDKQIANISSAQQFEKLNFYKLSDQQFSPKVFATTKGIYFGSDGNDSFISALQVADYKKGDIYFTDPQKTSLELANSKQIIVKSQEFPYANLNVSIKNALQELPYIRFLPDSPFYPLIRIKEKIGLFLAGNNSFPQILEYSNKRIVETFRLVEKDEYPLAQKSLDDYIKAIKEISARKQNITETRFKEDLLRQEYVLKTAIKTLDEKNINTDKYKETLDLLDKLLYDIKMMPFFSVNFRDYRSYSFSIPEDGFYNLILDTRDLLDFFKGDSLEMIIDSNDKKKVKLEKEGEQIPISYYFTTGKHQIDILLPQKSNLITQNSDSTFETTHDTKQYNFQISPYSPLARYRVSFDYFVEKGSLPSAYLIQDTDLVEKGKIVPKISFSLKMDSYYRGWRHFEEVFSPDPVSHKATVVFEVKPWNNCEELNPGFLQGRCKTKSFYESFDKETVVRIKNFAVQRDDLGSMLLVKERSQAIDFNPPSVSYEKINPAVYSVSITNATSPFYLAFLESYHPLWKAYIIDQNGSQEEIPEKDHLLINSFANAWYIDNIGSYRLLLKFYPEELFIIGKSISLAALGISFLILSLVFIKRRFLKE